ncbi:hypothetical protein [Pantoea rwandensis]|nr:hypothetical protein [Pantoea rwandensis]
MQKIIQRVMQTALDEQRLVGMEVTGRRVAERVCDQVSPYALQEAR